MRNLYRAPPRPGKGKGHPAKRGGVGWAIRKRNDETDDGSGWLYVLTGMGGPSCDVIVVGQTRNHPSARAWQILKRNLVKHWFDSRVIGNRHKSEPPQLWASRSTDRKRDDRRIHRLLVDDYFAREEEGGQPEIAIDLVTALRVMAEVTAELPTRFSLIPPEK